MCGRYSLHASPPQVLELFDLPSVGTLPPRYNIAPTQAVPVVRLRPGTVERELVSLRWGLILSWAKEAKTGAPLINARAETVSTKPAFRAAFRSRRCLLPANGFYEWSQQSRPKQPFYFFIQDHALFAFAGLWEAWQGPDGETIESCAILTTEANPVVAKIHPRMPVLLAREHFATYLQVEPDALHTLAPLLVPFPFAQMAVHPVSPLVNSPANDTPECVAPRGQIRLL